MRTDDKLRLLWLPLPVVILAAVTFQLLGATAPRESPELLTLFNTLFLGSVSLFTALLAWQSARHNPQRGMTSLGCGALTLGLIGLLAGPLIHDMNVAITIFNVGLAGSGACFVLSAVRGLLAHDDVTAPVDAARRVNLMYVGTLALVGALSAAAALGLTPLFFSVSEGSTPVRTAVLGLATVAYTAAAAVFYAGYRRSQMPFALWFAAAMALLAGGIAIVALTMPGSPAGWVGRAAQWSGALFMFFGIVSTARLLGSFALPLREALSEAELRLQLVMDSAGIGVFELDYATGRLHWDKTVRRHFGVAPEARVDLETFLRLVHPDNVADVRRLQEQSADPSGDGEFHAEYRILHQPEGDVRWVLARGRVLFQDGVPLRMLGVLMDVTERRSLEEALAQRARLEAELTDLDALAHSTLAIDEVLGRLLRNAAEALRCDTAHIVLTPAAGLARLSWSHPDDEPVPPTANGSTPGGGLSASLYLREAPVGAMTFSRREGASFGRPEEDFVRKLATTVSLALTNSRLFGEQEAVARGLQEHFIHELPAVSGLELEVATQPAFDPLLIGGDFHDVHELPDGNVSILIGDVEGKGIKAAGLTEAVRSAVRSLCFVMPSPRYVLGTVNRLLLAEDTPQFVTALLVVLDPRTGRGSMASAGHPPPLRVAPAGAEFIEPPLGSPLGAFATDYEAMAFELAVGETLVFYTDGLTEARHEAEELGHRRLLDAASTLVDADPLRIVTSLRSLALEFADAVRDDLEILAVRRTGVVTPGSAAGAASLTLAVPQWAGALRHVRDAVRDFLGAHHVDAAIVDDLVLCIDEACANGLEHGCTDEPMSLRVELAGDSVEILIADEGCGFDPSAVAWEAPERLVSGGRGLYLMQELCDSMEISSGTGTAVRMLRRLEAKPPSSSRLSSGGPTASPTCRPSS